MYKRTGWGYSKEFFNGTDVRNYFAAFHNGQTILLTSILLLLFQFLKQISVFQNFAISMNKNVQNVHNA